VSKTVIDVLSAAVQSEPQNAELRLHLAAALLEAGEHARALDECRAVLAAHPDHEQALRVAASAAEASGAETTAASYRRLASALSARAQGGEGEVVRLHSVRAPNGRHGSVEERPAVTLADVGGLESVKRRLRAAFLAPLENPSLRRLYGKSLRGGLLLWGPPGCGKTFVARALAGELGARFVTIGLHEILGMYSGESERNLHEVFEQARRSAPTVLFLDEVDALGRRRSQVSDSSGRDLSAQLLSELDGVAAENEGVFVLAASNHPWDVDTALRRPGRLDRTLLVLPPDVEAREAILRYHLNERPVEDDVDVAALARVTTRFSGADLAHLCETAAEHALEACLERGATRGLSAGDFELALGEVRPSTGPWLQLARNYAEFGSDGGSYDELVAYLRAPW
jgi:SpoVK/Ycf46/Vps4 family AAA+-type ATPase